MAGITASKTIVAVNRDAKAPIFDIADIGVVQDAGDFLPRVTERVRKQVMRQMADMVCGQPRNSTGSGIGCKIRQLREAHGWTGQHLAQITGQTPEYIDQVESEAFSPSVGFLLRLAGVLKVDPGTFLGKDRQARIDGRREREFVKRTRNYSYRTLTPGAESDHLRAFMVTIESRQAHKPVALPARGRRVRLCHGRRPRIDPRPETPPSEGRRIDALQFGNPPSAQKPFSDPHPLPGGAVHHLTAVDKFAK